MRGMNGLPVSPTVSSTSSHPIRLCLTRRESWTSYDFLWSLPPPAGFLPGDLNHSGTPTASALVPKRWGTSLSALPGNLPSSFPSSLRFQQLLCARSSFSLSRSSLFSHNSQALFPTSVHSITQLTTGETGVWPSPPPPSACELCVRCSDPSLPLKVGGGMQGGRLDTSKYLLCTGVRALPHQHMTQTHAKLIWKLWWLVLKGACQKKKKNEAPLKAPQGTRKLSLHYEYYHPTAQPLSGLGTQKAEPEVQWHTNAFTTTII